MISGDFLATNRIDSFSEFVAFTCAFEIHARSKDLFCGGSFLNGPLGYHCEYNKIQAKKTKCQNNNDDGTMEEASSNPIAIAAIVACISNLK